MTLLLSYDTHFLFKNYNFLFLVVVDSPKDTWSILYTSLKFYNRFSIDSAKRCTKQCYIIDVSLLNNCCQILISLVVFQKFIVPLISSLVDVPNRDDKRSICLVRFNYELNWTNLFFLKIIKIQTKSNWFSFQFNSVWFFQF